MSETPTRTRYSLRTRTPAGAKNDEPTGETPLSPRKRTKTVGSVGKTTPRAGKTASVVSAVSPRTPRGRGRGASSRVSTPTKTQTRGRGQRSASTRRSGRSGAAAAAAAAGDASDTGGSSEDDEDAGGVDAAAVSSEDEDYEGADHDNASEDGETGQRGAKRRHGAPAMGRAASLHGVAGAEVRGGVAGTPTRRGPGRPRKGEEYHRAPRAGVGASAPTTPAKKSWEIRRIPVHLTKHDAFQAEYLEDAIRIMHQIPVNGTANDDRYELMKMCDALKLCGYELGVVDPTTEPFFDVYRMLAWSVHPAGPNGSAHPPPPISDDARSMLVRVFASIGRRIREETKDMAGYHRRHVLRKLMLADCAEQPSARSPSIDTAVGDSASRTARENAMHRRNPLKIPGPLIDIWREPFKKSAADNDDHDTQMSDA
ncbi:hypothetical protein LPJ72_003457 [Coemansia sp. Benny D160-2]|nr:hypothetical protein LPJ72_003457 [Coemansia sp. Benny D160-2]